MRHTLLLLTIIRCAAALAPHAAVAQVQRRPSRLEGSSFGLARYASTGTLSLFGAIGRGPAIGMVGVVRNPRTDYRTLMLGGGTRLRLGIRDGVTVLAAIAGGSAGPALRLYVLPSFRIGSWGISGTSKAFMPLRSDGHWQAAIDPLTVSLRVSRVASAGVAGVVRVQGGKATALGGGPYAALRFRGISLKAEAIRLTRSTGLETRVTLGMAF